MVIYWLHNMDWMLIINYIICRLYPILSLNWMELIDYVPLLCVSLFWRGATLFIILLPDFEISFCMLTVISVIL